MTLRPRQRHLHQPAHGMDNQWCHLRPADSWRTRMPRAPGGGALWNLRNFTDRISARLRQPPRLPPCRRRSSRTVHGASPSRAAPGPRERGHTRGMADEALRGASRAQGIARSVLHGELHQIRWGRVCCCWFAGRGRISAAACTVRRPIAIFGREALPETLCTQLRPRVGHPLRWCKSECYRSFIRSSSSSSRLG